MEDALIRALLTSEISDNTHPTEAGYGRDFLNASMDGDLVPLMIIEAHLGRLDMHLLLPVGQPHSQRNAAVAQRQIEIVSAVARIEEQSVRLAGAKVERNRILGTDNGLSASLAQVVREELCTAERCLRWRLLLLTILAIVLQIATLAYRARVS